ncbi:NAD(P)H:quinone oxidoreductase [Umboniibacter marinipuniceus]|uniref:NAD(P)H dehydrogenase (Quinone) n=1 Tax=Umboniibacter marinipuniceus TaxID=569599 RepID=A0A3M0A1W9_9GAMM|nr:NAD(P)H:quinone oxidoreductase [Umboniibacter marinipuniceus]RMA78810.1 NAD(P)H dehydrogenase (quinone) [Umboniibacter marinipuniceus]
MSSSFILVLYYSVGGSVKALAEQIALGIEASGMSARVRTVPAVSSTTEATSSPVPDEGDLYCEYQDLRDCSALALGSPTRFGNMAAALKYFIDGSSDLWLSGDLIDKPFGVFTSSASLHGGQETTLMSMAIPLLHHGMIWAGVPYSVAELGQTSTGGTPYGPSHVSGSQGTTTLTADEIAIARAYGKRLGQLAQRLERSL